MFQGGLFTRDWLIEGVRETAAWAALEDRSVEETREDLTELLTSLGRRRSPNEAQTEAELIWPVLRRLGWANISVQQNMTARGRKDVPDALLFASAEADASSEGLEPWQRFRFGAALVEAKRWGRPLDREGAGDQGVPSTQVMHYLRRADDITEGRLRWGILTNGRQWRLYWQGALSIAEDFFEIDLGKVLGLPGCPPELFDPPIESNHALRLFLLIFGREAFLPTDRGRTFHALALEAGRQWEAKVARDLSDVVFRDVFPALVGAIGEHDGARPTELHADYLEQVRSTALILLYRLLFVLYAEDRNLLPDEHGPYRDHSLTRLRQEIADRRASGGVFPIRSFNYWSRLETIFDAIAHGSDELGIPPYNGGLFDPVTAPLIARVRLPDPVIADVLGPLSHRLEGGRPRYINYRDLSVQQLGSIYESILEYAVEADGAGGVRPRADGEARHRSGSYYTPEELVSLIIDRAVGPLVEERVAAFEAAVAHGATGEALAALDPATRLLNLKIVDPAMGSGHFLVSLVDWLSDAVLTAIGDAEAAAGDGYRSPLVAEIVAARAEIEGHADAHGWPIVQDQLDDRHIVRRMVLKRCVFGVDLNPMAVELAKVALWLHSFTVGAPLSFLDHHLRCGNSVLGAWVRPVTLWLANRGSLMMNQHLAHIDNVAATMAELEATPDTDLAEVEQSKALFGVVAKASAPLDALLSLIEADALMGVADDKPRRIRESAEQIERVGRATVAQMPDGTEAERMLKAKALAKVERTLAQAADAERRYGRAEAFKLILEGAFGDPARIASGEIEVADPGLRERGAGGQTTLLPSAAPDETRRLTADALVREARALAEQHRFFNWEVAFPGVWRDLASSARSGGFDAVIGNPPYVRQEEIAEIKPALKPTAKSGFESYAGMADLYVYFYEQGLKLLRPGGRMAYVVTNKWLKAGYAENLRRLFAEQSWIEALVDLGHAKRFFPDADVFPSVLVARKPDGGNAPETFDLAVIPRDQVPGTGLDAAVAAASYPARRDQLTSEPWTLERPDVAALFAKLRARGVPLAEYAGVRPLYGIKTGLNEAYLIDTATKERLIREDPHTQEIIKPYLRGQDIDRWLPDWAGLWMIVMKSSSDHPWPWAGALTEAEAETIFARVHPALHRHFQLFESTRDPETGKLSGLRHRDDQGRFWWELRPCAYYDAFARPKLIMKMMAYNSRVSVDDGQYLTNNAGVIIPTNDDWLHAVIQSPIQWHYQYNTFPHKKDETIAMDIPYLHCISVPDLPPEDKHIACEAVAMLRETTLSVRTADRTIADWLRVEQGLSRLPGALGEASLRDADAFVAAVRAALPKRETFGPGRLKQVRDAFAEIAEPARAQRITALSHERVLSGLVNRAYGLTPEEEALMWRTAPPRMPLAESSTLAVTGSEQPAAL